MNTRQTTALLIRMRAIWTDIPSSDDIIAAWSWALEDADPEAVMAAVKQLMKTSTFAPKPAEVLHLIAESATGLPTPSAAWGIVEARIKDPNNSAYAASPLVREAVKRAFNDIGELRKESTDIGRAEKRRAFITAYTELRDQAVTEVQTGAVPVLPAQPRRGLVQVAKGIYASHPNDRFPRDAASYTLPVSAIAALPARKETGS